MVPDEGVISVSCNKVPILQGLYFYPQRETAVFILVIVFPKYNSAQKKVVHAQAYQLNLFQCSYDISSFLAVLHHGIL